MLLPALLVLTPLVAGCASRPAEPHARTDDAAPSGADADSVELADAEDEQAAEEIELARPGPPVSPPVAAIAATREQSEDESPRGRRPRSPREQGPGPAGGDEVVAEQPDDTTILVQASRADGRPEWWIDSPDHSDGRLRIAAEALGHDVLEARRAAISAGRRALERLAGTEAHDERVEYATVRPLPRGASPSGPRYVGYVLMSSVDPAAE